MKKNFTVFFIVMVTMVVLAACGSSEGTTGESNTEAAGEGESYTFKLTHITGPSHNWHQTAEKFSEELEALSNGRMTLEIFPSGQLGSEGDMIQQIETGTVDFGFITNAYLSTRVDTLNGWFMPFLFEDLEAANAAKGTPEAKQMLEDLSNDSMIALDFAFAGNRHILMTDGTISSPDELQGKRIRVIGSPAIQDFWVETGASPTPMPLPEVYTSLQTGVIDGIDIDLDALVSNALYEIAHDLTLTNHMAFPSVAIMSRQTRDSLSEEDIAIVDEALATAIEWGIQDQIQREIDNLEYLKEQGLNIIDFNNTNAFDSINAVVYEKYSENETIRSIIEAYK
ncbi:tripartite ATP-independent transporter DctP family solute receptor [Evansella vedderi]|uniref:Tripartite ATP-independent transporter DctP family solute receptor n=1 Tax=Evansella vedderi TaxID=38282 RepID=A0ABT9ZRD4_9BACI|nr:TRAP transporter substrate-binding protein [Evansella vedderi]MDQ0253301.1 tripartite ATP-independent transporter DctP family solute receptor [Evansella vedderi]